MATQPIPVPIKPVFPIVQNENGELIHQTPERLHPGFIAGDSGAANTTRSAFTAASKELASLNTKWVKGAPDFQRSLQEGYRSTISPRCTMRSGAKG